MKYIDFIQKNYKPKASDVVAEFYVERDSKSLLSMEQAIGAIASESSIGTWTELSTEKEYMKKLGAKVFYVKKIGNTAFIKIAYPKELFEFDNIPNFMSGIAGNVFGLKDIKNLKLEDINFPSIMIKKFKGPMHGIHGVRKLLKVKDRPLLGTIIKPKLGLNSKDHAKVAYNAWLGGCDIVKDDENLSSQKFNKFENRLKETFKMKEKAEKETGEKKVYMINVTAETNEMMRRAKMAKDIGNEYMMVDILTVGWGALQTLRDYNQDLKLVMHAHRAGHAAFTRNPNHGISMLIIAKLARLIGIDQIHIGTIAGKMGGTKKEVVALDQEMEDKFIHARGHILEENWLHIKPVFAVCSGGLHPGNIPPLVRNLGKNIIIQMGGGIHGNKLGTVKGAIAARQAINAVMKDVSLEEYAKTHYELKSALEQFCKK